MARCAGICSLCLSICLDQSPPGHSDFTPSRDVYLLKKNKKNKKKSPSASLASLAELAACHKSFYNKLHKPLLVPKYLWMPALLSRAWFVSEAQSGVNLSGAAPGLLSDSRNEELVRELWWSAPCKLHHHGQRIPRKE